MKALRPLSFLYKKIAGLKNYLYDQDYVQPVELPIPVISLGNLTMGGTGKTPLTNFCLKFYQRRNVKTAVISRNYQAEVSDMVEVDLNRKNAAAYFGDEPVLLAKRNPGVHFFVGPQKYQTAQYAFEKVKPALLVVDDGFQHRKLHRDVDIVILDATEEFENYACVPVGRAREPWEALSRASVFVISKANLAPKEKLEKLVEKLQPFGKLIVPTSFELTRLIDIQEAGAGRNLKECQGRKALLVSGIGQPCSFEKNLENFGLQIVDHIIFKDHHVYKGDDIQVIINKWHKYGASEIITTEKDFVKLKDLWPKDVPLSYSPLEVQILSQEDEFYEILDQALH